MQNSTAATASGNIHNYDGKIGFLNTATVDLSIVLAISTLGKENIEFTYDIMTIRNPFGDGTNNRINEVTLQYRIGNTGSFINIPSTLYQNNTTTQTSGTTTPQNLTNISVILPSACNNQANVQIRWVSREVSGGGSRPSFAVDNIVSDGDNLPVPVLSVNPAGVNFSSILANSGPSLPEEIELSGTNLDNTDVLVSSPTDYEVSLDGTSFSSSLTFSSFDGSPTSFFVRLKSGLPAGTYLDELEISGGGVTNPLTVGLSITVAPVFEIDYENPFRTVENYNLAILQGFQSSTDNIQSGAGGYLLLNNSDFVQTPTIDFTEHDALDVSVSIATFGSGSGRELSLLISVDNNPFEEVATFNNFEGATHVDFNVNIDLTGDFNSSVGVLRWEMTSGTGGIRFRDLSIEDAQPLPVDLLTFTAQARNQQTVLNWTFDNARGFERFEVEHATDRQGWANIGTVRYTETLSRAKQASHVHERPAAGVNYYRLKMIDTDGSFQYSRIQSVTHRGLGGISPVNTLVSSELILQRDEQEGEARIMVLDAQGRVVYQQVLAAQEAHWSIPSADWMPGVYMLQVQHAGATQSFKLVK